MKVVRVGGRQKVCAADVETVGVLPSEAHESCPTADRPAALHPLFEEILRPLIEATRQKG